MSETSAPEFQTAAQAPDRNLALELVRVTEAAAMAAGRWVGRGDKNGADGVAVNAMRVMISTIGMRGTVVIGEGEKDNAPMLYNGEEVGDGTGPECDVAVDPIDGTTLTAKGMTNAVSVLAVSPRGTMYDPSAVFYMEKLVVGPEAADAVDIRFPVAENIHRVAKAKHKQPSDVTVVLLDRPRHAQLVDEIRATGAMIKFITDGDVAAPSWPPAPRPASTSCSASAARPRASSPPVRSRPSTASSRGGCGRRTTPSGRRRSTPATTSTPTTCSPPTTSSPVTTRSSSPPASPTASS